MMSIPRELEVTIYPPGGADHDPAELRSTPRAGSACWSRRSSGSRAVGQPRGGDRLRPVQARGQRAGVRVLDGRSPLLPRQQPERSSTRRSTCSPAIRGCAAPRRCSSSPTATTTLAGARRARPELPARRQAEYGASLSDNVRKFERIFGQAVQTDPGLHSTSGPPEPDRDADLLRSLRVRQVPFQVNLSRRRHRVRLRHRDPAADRRERARVPLRRRAVPTGQRRGGGARGASP